MRILSVEEILAAQDLQEKVVPVPEWGEDAGVLIRAFARNRIAEMREAATIVGPGGKRTVDNVRLELLMFIYGVVEPSFTAEHYDALSAKSYLATTRVIKEILEISGMADDAVKKEEIDFRE